MVVSVRFGGMARTRAMVAACSGAQRRVGEQRVDRGEAVVAGADAVAARGFEVVEERADQRGVKVGEVEPRGRRAQLLLGEAQQQAEGVAVGGDGVRAGLALAISRSVKNACRIGASAVMAGPRSCSGRGALKAPAVTASSSGAACRYQLFRYRNNWYYSDSRVIPMPAPSLRVMGLGPGMTRSGDCRLSG